MGALILSSCSLFAGNRGLGAPPSPPEGNSPRTPEGSSQRTPEGSSPRTPEGSSHIQAKELTRAEALALAVETQLVPVVQFKGEEHFEKLDARMRALKVPAVSIAVFENYEIVWAKAYGLARKSSQVKATTETRFQAASISKPVNALTLIRIAQKFGFSLDAPVNGLLKSWRIPKHMWSDSNPVTLRQLLSHTAGTTVHGFPGYRIGQPIPSTKQILDGKSPSNSRAVRVDRRPGTGARYSGGGVMISQLLAEDLSQQSYSEIASQYTLTPLQMTSSGFEQPTGTAENQMTAAAHDRDGATIPGLYHVYPEQAAAGLWTTPVDLAKFFIAIAKARAGIPSELSPQEAQIMTSPTYRIPGEERALSPGFFLEAHNGHPVFGHGGSNHGFRCEAIASLSEGFGYVVMTNSERGGELIKDIRRTLLSQPGWPQGYGSLIRTPLPEGLAESFVGLYQTEGLLTFQIEPHGPGLRVRRPFRSPRELIFVGRGRFVDPVDRSFYSIDSRGGPLELKSEAGPVRQAHRRADSGKAPLWVLSTASVGEAVAAWHRFALGVREDKLIDHENELNMLGYELARQGDLDGAHKLLHFVSLVRPHSFNAFDSLAEVESMRGNHEAALTNYERSLELLRKDPSVSRADREVIRQRVKKHIAGLRLKLGKATKRRGRRKVRKRASQ